MPHELPASTQVLIVGAGPTGLAAANLLGLYGIGTTVIECDATTSTIPKGIYIDDEFFRTLDAVGIASDVYANCVPAAGVTYFSRLGFQVAAIEGRITSNGYGNRSAIWQPEFEQALVERASAWDSVEVCFEWTLVDLREEDGRVAVAVTGADGGRQELVADYVLGCDGGRSTVRKLLGMPMDGRSYEQRWAVIDMLDDTDPSPFSKYFVYPQRPTDSIPGPRGGRRFEFMLLPGEDPDAMLEDESLRRLFGPYRDFDRLTVFRKAVYTFHALFVRNMRVGRVFLLGDAAHLMPPFGASGMNSGNRDAVNLCWKIAAVLRGQASPAILSTYDLERREHVQAVIDISVTLGRIVNLTTTWLAYVRDVAFWLLARAPITGPYLTGMRYIPRVVLREGLVLPPAGRLSGSFVGRMLPQPVVRTDAGDDLLLDRLLGPGFALIGLACQGDDVDLQDVVRHGLWNDLQVRAVTIAGHAADARPGVVALGDGRFDALLTQHRGDVLLVRPDRYVSAAVAPAELTQLEADLRRLLEGRPGQSHA